MSKFGRRLNPEERAQIVSVTGSRIVNFDITNSMRWIYCISTAENRPMKAGGFDSQICPGLAKEIESKAAAEAVWIILRSALHARLFLSTGMHVVCSPVEDERSQKS